MGMLIQGLLHMMGMGGGGGEGREREKGGVQGDGRREGLSGTLL